MGGGMKRMIVMVFVSVMLCLSVVYKWGFNKMPEIKFDMGQNIHETAKKSGAPRYSTRNIQGLVSYAIVNLAPEVTVNYIRPGFKFVASPLFAFTLYADKEIDSNLGVETASLQYDTDAISSHEAAKAFVENLISQFQGGQWKRYVRDLCPAVTGRSAFLNEEGERERIGFCPLDPAYRLTSDEWIAMMGDTQNYQWLGDGILASLTISYSNDSRGITYSIQLELDDFAIKTKREDAQQMKDLEEGDAAGWKSTEDYKKGILARQLRVKSWEEAARKRGDTVLSR
jgi:hypothetical protein